MGWDVPESTVSLLESHVGMREARVEPPTPNDLLPRPVPATPDLNLVPTICQTPIAFASSEIARKRMVTSVPQPSREGHST